MDVFILISVAQRIEGNWTEEWEGLRDNWRLYDFLRKKLTTCKRVFLYVCLYVCTLSDVVCVWPVSKLLNFTAQKT